MSHLQFCRAALSCDKLRRTQSRVLFGKGVTRLLKICATKSQVCRRCKYVHLFQRLTAALSDPSTLQEIHDELGSWPTTMVPTTHKDFNLCIMIQAQKKTFRLGRHSAKQGPRPMTNNRGRVEQELIGRWDSERELFTTILHTYFKISKKRTYFV